MPAGCQLRRLRVGRASNMLVHCGRAKRPNASNRVQDSIQARVASAAAAPPRGNVLGETEMLPRVQPRNEYRDD
jgi:hypothetical protein